MKVSQSHQSSLYCKIILTGNYFQVTASTKYFKELLGQTYKSLNKYSTTVSRLVFSSTFIWIKQWSKHNLGITVIPAFLTKNPEFGRLEVEIFIEIWFWLNSATLTANGNLLWNAKRETWWYQTQFRFQTANRRQVTKNTKLRHTRKLL